jgi:hypothetical protein
MATRLNNRQPLTNRVSSESRIRLDIAGFSLSIYLMIISLRFILAVSPLTNTQRNNPRIGSNLIILRKIQGIQGVLVAGMSFEGGVETIDCFSLLPLAQQSPALPE